MTLGLYGPIFTFTPHEHTPRHAPPTMSKNLRAVHFADSDKNPRAICNHHLGLSIGRRRSLPPLLTRDPLKITCGKCQNMCAGMIERAKSATVTA